MARLPMYQQQTVMDSPRASGAEFGGQVGQAMAQTGNVLQDIGVTMKRREDVIDRTVRARDFDNWAQESLRALETQDLARGETLEQYRQGLQARMDEVLGAHRGTSASRAEFKNQLLNQMYQYEKGAREAQVRAQHTLLGQIVEQRTNQIATQVAFAPELMEQGLEELDARLNEFSDALPAPAVEQYRNAARSNMISTAVTTMMSNGALDAAEEVVRNPNFNRYLNPDQSRRFVLNIAAEKGRINVEERRRQGNIETVASVLGIPSDQMTPQQREIAANFDGATMNLAQKLSLVQMINGEVTPEQRNRLLGLERQGRTSAIQSLTSQVPAFLSGRMTPDEQVAFKVEALRMFPEQWRQDPTTGSLNPIPGSGGVRALMRAIGMEVTPSGSTTREPIGGIPQGASSFQMDEDMDNSFIDEFGRQDFRALPPQPGESGYSPEGGDLAEDPELTSTADEIISQGGLWGLADKVAGPVAGIQRGIGSGPVDLGIGQPQVAAARRVELVQRRLVSALQQNPRYAEGERQDIAKSISIEPSVMSNPTAYRTRLIEIGRYFEDEIRYNQQVLQQPPSETTVQMRQQAMQAISLMGKMLETLQLPPTVKTPEEALRMNPRPAQVITPDGRVMNVPQN